RMHQRRRAPRWQLMIFVVPLGRLRAPLEACMAEDFRDRLWPVVHARWQFGGAVIDRAGSCIVCASEPADFDGFRWVGSFWLTREFDPLHRFGGRIRTR